MLCPRKGSRQSVNQRTARKEKSIVIFRPNQTWRTFPMRCNIGCFSRSPEINRLSLRPKRFRAKWGPVRARKTRQTKNSEASVLDSIKAETGARDRSPRRRNRPAVATSYCSASCRYRSSGTRTLSRPSSGAPPTNSPGFPASASACPISDPSRCRCSPRRSDCKPQTATARPFRPRPSPARSAPPPRCRSGGRG